VSTPTRAIGVFGSWHHGRVDPDAALAFALATDDPNEACTTGQVVPPLFTAALILGAQAEAQLAGTDRSGFPSHGVHAEHDVTFYSPVPIVEPIQWSAATTLVKQTPAGALTSQQIIVTDGEENPLVGHRWSSIYVGASANNSGGTELPDHTFPEAARSSPIDSYTFDVTADQGFRYGGASGDRPPHSLDDELARLEGFPSKILQGMCTFAMCGAAVTRLSADGDPLRLRRLAGRFAAPVHPKRELTISVYDAGATSAGLRKIAFEAISDGVTVVKHGLAEVHPR
jgi:acyl dehydratase